MMRSIRLHLGNACILVAHAALARFPRRAAEGRGEVPPPGSGLAVRESTIPGAGLGLFAERDYRRDEVVTDYQGEPMSTLGMLRTPDLAYMMGLGRDASGRRIWIDGRNHLGCYGRCANHSSDPSRMNLRLSLLPDERRAVLIADRDIAQGEELFFDYGPRHWRCFEWRPDIVQQDLAFRRRT
jgi:hypothetical protein